MKGEESDHGNGDDLTGARDGTGYGQDRAMAQARRAAGEKG